MSSAVLESRWLMDLEVGIDPPSVTTPTMLAINVREARAEGPRLKASAIAPSGDWARIQDNGNWKIDARLAFVTDDGEPFSCYYSGLIQMDEQLAQRGFGRCDLRRLLLMRDPPFIRR